MKKMLYRTMAVCMLALPLTAVAQSPGDMKQDQTHQDPMKQS